MVLWQWPKPVSAACPLTPGRLAARATCAPKGMTPTRTRLLHCHQRWADLMLRWQTGGFPFSVCALEEHNRPTAIPLPYCSLGRSISRFIHSHSPTSIPFSRSHQHDLSLALTNINDTRLMSLHWNNIIVKTGNKAPPLPPPLPKQPKLLFQFTNAVDQRGCRSTSLHLSGTTQQNQEEAW